MAHAAKLGAQTDEFVSAFTGLSLENKTAEFNTKRDAAYRVFRYGAFPRVNQFDVEANLDGLEEKFRIYQKEGLADALRSRLNELPQFRMKWMPEILHLLLELSDRPVQKTNLADVEAIQPPEVEVEKTWKWNELVKEEPLLRDKIWKNINYAAESSEEEIWSESEAEESSITESTPSSVVDRYATRPEHLALPIVDTELKTVQEDQFWKKVKAKPANIVDAYFDKPEPVEVSELQAIRETLFMLRGLPTTLYATEGNLKSVPQSPFTPAISKETKVKPVLGFALSTTSSEIFYDILGRFAEFGATIAFLREWNPMERHEVLMKRIHQEIVKQVRNFDRLLTELESEYQEPEQDVVISLTKVENIISSTVPLYQQLARIVSENQKWVAYRWLEAFYEASCIAQMAGDTSRYSILGNIFFSCLDVYLRPLRRWMEDGELEHGFFVKESAKTDRTLSYWERYEVDLDTDGTPVLMPKFLHVAVDKIVTSGKSVVVLKKLDKYAAIRASWPKTSPPLDFQSVCGADPTSLLPFPELFAEAFGHWVKAKHHATAATLRQVLFEDCGLGSTIDALEQIYFMSDGATSSTFFNAVFASLDRGKAGWNDPFTLTELARETIGQLPDVVSERLRIATTSSTMSVEESSKSVISLGTIQVAYRLPWAVSLIIRPSTLATYRSIFTFLLQLRRAESILTVTSSNFRFLNTNEPAEYCKLRFALLWFCSTIYTYLTSLVISTDLEKLRKELEEAGDVDAMLGAHDAFVRGLHAKLLLGDRLQPIRKAILQILDLAVALRDAKTDAQHPGTRPQRSKSRTKSNAEDSDSESLSLSLSDSEEEDDEDADVEMSNPPDVSAHAYHSRLTTLNIEFDRLIRFIIAGLRGVARTGEEEMWDVLAEMLEGGMSGVVSDGLTGVV